MRIRWVGAHGARLSIVLRAGAITMAVVLAGCLLVWGIDLGKRVLDAARTRPGPTPQMQLAALQSELTLMQMERDRVVAAAKATPAQSIQIKSLQVENGKLLEDMAVLARQLPGKGPFIPRAARSFWRRTRSTSTCW